MIIRLLHVVEIKIYGYGTLTLFPMIIFVTQYYKDIHKMSNTSSGSLINNRINL